MRRLFFCTGLAILACGAHSAVAQEPPCTVLPLAPVEVTAIDSHLDLRLADGRKLRLRGIDPPRGTAADPQLAETARRYLTAQISGQRLSAAMAGERDRWGRHAADVITASAPQTLNEKIISAGLARVDAGDAPPGCLPALLRSEGQARQAGRGLWADPAYAILDAGQRGNLAARGGQIVIMEGNVVSTAVNAGEILQRLAGAKVQQLWNQ